MMFGWLKRSLPRGLFGRSLLILVLPVVTLLLIISVSFVQRHFEGVTRQMTDMVILELRFITDRVSAVPDVASANAVAASIATPLEYAFTYPVADVPNDDFKRWYDLSGGFVIDRLRSGMDEVLAVYLVTDRRVELWLDMPLGPMQVSFERLRLSASNPHQLLVMIVVLGALMIGIASLFLRNQLRPIRKLAEVASDYGRGRLVPFTPSGAAEVRAAGMAFLDMRARIERHTQSRTMMLSGVSHDLRTPLTRLRLGLSMLDDAEAAPLIGDVDEMQRLVDAFLDFARDEAGDLMEELDPVGLVADVVADCRRAGEPVFFDAATPPIAPMALRPMAIRRAVENLVGNALRYGSTAWVSLNKGAKSLTITVEDDGPGIPAESREEAQRPFTRLDPARNQDKGSGVGLGLAIVAEVARAHGGTLRLGVSETHGGLRADIVLPL
jgi:two-component system osmolarity sensor histidine kinase EnvZ